MRHHQTFAGAAALLLALCSSSFAQWRCSSDTVRGTWGYQSHFTVMMNVPGSSSPVPVPFVGLGIMKIDYQGRFTDHATISVGGQVQDVDVAGSIQVNPDCTATDTCTGSVECAGRYVILDNGNEMRYMPTKFPLGPAVGMAYFRRIASDEGTETDPIRNGVQDVVRSRDFADEEPQQCTSDMVRGVYGGSAEGTYMVPVPGQPQAVPTPFSGIFAMTFQHGGTGTAVATASMGGSIFDVEFSEMSMHVNPDCTATMKYTGVSKQAPGQTFTGTVKYVVLNHGNELIGMETESNVGLPIELESHKRISMVPIVPDR